MLKAFAFCMPIKGIKVPAGPEWLHEIKYDGYRLRVERNGDRVRLITRGGYNWTKRYPWIAEAALKNRQKHFVIDGEAVILGVDGYSDFDAPHSGKHNEGVQLLRLRRTCNGWHRLEGSAALDAQGQSGTPIGAQAGRHFPERLRAG
jgi:hypothetical protein